MSTGENDARAGTVKAAADVCISAFARGVGSAVANYIVSTIVFVLGVEIATGIKYVNTIGADRFV